MHGKGPETIQIQSRTWKVSWMFELNKNSAHLLTKTHLHQPTLWLNFACQIEGSLPGIFYFFNGEEDQGCKVHIFDQKKLAL